jgi:integrase
MGKNLKGKECGKGICQRKDGKYMARFLSKDGRRNDKYFQTLPEAKRWLADAQYEERNGSMAQVNPTAFGMTVDGWYQYWQEHLICDLAPNTRRNYEERYRQNIQPVIGKMKLSQVKPMHCKRVFNRMEEKYAGSTIGQAYITLGKMFRDAVNNKMILEHPMTGVRFNKPMRAVDDFNVLTVEAQQKFLRAAEKTHNYRQYALLLETGLRVGEMIALTWDSIDWENRCLTVSKSMEYRYAQKQWSAGPTKTQSGYRTIPLTEKAYAILKACYDERETRKESRTLSQNLKYLDRRSAGTRSFSMRDLVFINWRTGEPTKTSSYDTHLVKLCKEAGIGNISMHTLRHTYATRAIESGMPPKILQKLLGHASIKTTMDRYVHATPDAMKDAVLQFEAAYTNASP